MSEIKIDRLRTEHPNLDNYILSLTDIIAKLEVTNIDLANKNIKLQNELNEYSKCTSRVYPPDKSYKELEDKLALAENSKQTEIDELYETKIGPLQNKVKDQQIQLESIYKRETKYQQQIKELEQLAKDQDTVIGYIVGYLSGCEQFRNKHPLTIKTWFFNGWKDEI